MGFGKADEGYGMNRPTRKVIGRRKGGNRKWTGLWNFVKSLYTRQKERKILFHREMCERGEGEEILTGQFALFIHHMHAYLAILFFLDGLTLVFFA